MDNVTVIIPSYNEEESIGNVIEQIKALNPLWEILVVNDCSTDNTAEIAEEHGAKVVTHTYNLGNGASVKTGARNAKNDILVFMDGDGQHPPTEIPKLLQYLPQYDMVIGSRTHKSKTHWFRDLGNVGLIHIAERLSHHKIQDLTSGFRAVKKEAFMEFYHLYPLRYSYPTTITLSMLCSGRFVKFEPIDNIVKRRTGKSGIKPFIDGFRFINIIIRIILLFHPARVFMPLSVIFLILSILSSIFQLVHGGMIGSLSLLLFQTTVGIFITGVISEQISLMRQKPMK